MIRFPDGFLWGAATSAYQIEGAIAAHGRGPSVWDTFSHRPGVIANGDTGDLACAHVDHVATDVALMAELGLQAYRFSISWPRVLPAGTGDTSPEGLGFYDQLVDLLLDAGIAPVPTLFHWDTPAALEERGGWRNRDATRWFADYAATMARTLGDRVQMWSTLNEPWCYAYLGHCAGVHAPGVRDPAAAVAVAHHQLLGHGRAVTAMREVADLHLGVVLNPAPVRADVTEPPRADAVRRADGILNRWFLDAVLTGTYPDDVLADFGPLADCVRDGDLAEIAVPIDWLGINYYNDHIVRAPRRDEPLPMSPYPGIPDFVTTDAGHDVTDLGWPITPEGMHELLVGLGKYPHLPPIYITENGAAYDDPVVDGECVDTRRIAYLDTHLRAVHRVIENGIDVRGYFAWSLFDNFEWAHGYAMRFGLVHVDFETQHRTPRASAHWYREICRTNELR